MRGQNSIAPSVVVPPHLLDLRRHVLLYPRLAAIQREIEVCKMMTAMTGEPKCMSLEGEPGVGKTTTMLTYASAHPRYDTPDGTTIPVFYVETPSPVTVKGMAIRMLQCLGDPAAERGVLSVLNSRLVNLIRDCGVELVILDDSHHLIDRDSDRVLHSVSDWLKVLIKETGVSFLMVAEPGKAARILDANPQLQRLFVSRMTLDPFAWDHAYPSTLREWARFIMFLEEVYLPIRTELPRTELLYRIHYATNGIANNVVTLLTSAYLEATEQGMAVIGVNVLADAFDRRLRANLKGKSNPFRVPADTRFVPPASRSASRKST